jgi:hypothetical protein
MAKYLGSRGLKQMRYMFLKNDPCSMTILERETEIFPERNIIQTKPYRMCDLFPDTYKTMTEIPADMDFSQLRSADELFKGCESLKKVDGLNLQNAVCVRGIFEGCTSLESVTNLNAPNAVDWSFAFYNCRSLKSIEEMDMSHVQKFFSMFGGCTSLPEKFPWTLDMTAATTGRNMTSCNGSVFSFSSVKAVTVKDNFTINVPCRYSTDGAGNVHKSYFLHYMVDAAFQEYVQQHGMPSGNTLTLAITVPSCMDEHGGIPETSEKTGMTDYKVTIPDVADWAAGGALRELRANYLLGFSFHLKQVGPADGVYTYTDPVLDDSGRVTTPMHIKDYSDDPGNYQDITVYTPSIDAKNKTITFTASTEHLLKQSIALTIA